MAALQKQFVFFSFDQAKLQKHHINLAPTAFQTVLKKMLIAQASGCYSVRTEKFYE
jgi:hypothetical protein